MLLGNSREDQGCSLIHLAATASRQSAACRGYEWRRLVDTGLEAPNDAILDEQGAALQGQVCAPPACHKLAPERLSLLLQQACPGGRAAQPACSTAGQVSTGQSPHAACMLVTLVPCCLAAVAAGVLRAAGEGHHPAVGLAAGPRADLCADHRAGCGCWAAAAARAADEQAWQRCAPKGASARTALVGAPFGCCSSGHKPVRRLSDRLWLLGSRSRSSSCREPLS